MIADLTMQQFTTYCGAQNMQNRTAQHVNERVESGWNYFRTIKSLSISFNTFYYRSHPPELMDDAVFWAFLVCCNGKLLAGLHKCKIHSIEPQTFTNEKM